MNLDKFFHKCSLSFLSVRAYRLIPFLRGANIKLLVVSAYINDTLFLFRSQYKKKKTDILGEVYKRSGKKLVKNTMKKDCKKERTYIIMVGQRGRNRKRPSENGDRS